MFECFAKFEYSLPTLNWFSFWWENRGHQSCPVRCAIHRRVKTSWGCIRLAALWGLTCAGGTGATRGPCSCLRCLGDRRRGHAPQMKTSCPGLRLWSFPLPRASTSHQSPTKGESLTEHSLKIWKLMGVPLRYVLWNQDCIQLNLLMFSHHMHR